MKSEFLYSLEKLSNAVSRLKEGINSEKDQLDRDGVIQRFEFTYELVWKTLKLFLSEQGISTKSPRDAFKEAFRYGLIKDEDTFLDMIDDRNATSHIYSEEASQKIFSRLVRRGLG